MTNFYFWLFLGLMILPLVAVVWNPARIYEYPFFTAAIFAIFVFPQAVSLIRFPGAAPAHAVQSALLMTCLCLTACLLGYKLPIQPQVIARLSRGVNQQRLFHVGLIFVACGYWFGHLISAMDIEISQTGGWTGRATIYGFFQQLCYPGLAICLMTALRRPSLTSMLSALAAAVVPMQVILLGRREPAAVLLVTLGLTIYFRRRSRPPRVLIPGIILAAMLAIPATATYRSFQAERNWDAIRQIDFVGNFKQFLTDESILEFRNAAMLIEATSRSGDYAYGAGYWNHLVFRYVPAQILGEGFKESLMIRRSGEGQEREFATMDYTNPIGSTVTGMGDSFQQFGYWGCLFFAALAVFFRSLWQTALRPNALFAQLLYMQACTSAMRAVTHWTLDFLPGFLYSVLFLGAAMLYAYSSSLPKTRVLRRPRTHPRIRGSPRLSNGSVQENS